MDEFTILWGMPRFINFAMHLFVPSILKISIKVTLFEAIAAELPSDGSAVVSFHMAVGKTQINRVQSPVVKMRFVIGDFADIGGSVTFRVITDDGLLRHGFITCL